MGSAQGDFGVQEGSGGRGSQQLEKVSCGHPDSPLGSSGAQHPPQGCLLVSQMQGESVQPLSLNVPQG